MNQAGKLAAVAFKDAALDETGWTRCRIARELGEYPHNFYCFTGGSKPISLNKVVNWLKDWRNSGHQRYRLLVEIGETRSDETQVRLEAM